MSTFPHSNNPGPVGSIRFTIPWSDHADRRTDAIVENLIAERDAWMRYAIALETQGDAVISLFPRSSASFEGAAAIWANARKKKP